MSMVKTHTIDLGVSQGSRTPIVFDLNRSEPTFSKPLRYRGQAVGIGGVVVVRVAIVIDIAKVRGF